MKIYLQKVPIKQKNFADPDPDPHKNAMVPEH
jgi:hypothetical protein